MPIALLKKVYGVSSEDSSKPASNLLKNDPAKKWKTETCGENMAFVIFQLENEMNITGIDIGNEHSAFVEVLVARTRKPDDFKELILTSSFMTPIESRNSSIVNRVRCFNKERLIKSVSDEKWDLIKFICTQPFNKHIQYGLSFVTVHVTAPKNSESKSLVPDSFLKKLKISADTAKAETATKFVGGFKLREESPDSDTESALFNRWKQSKTPEATKFHNLNSSTAAEIRKASQPEHLKHNFDHLKPHKVIKTTETNRFSDDIPRRPQTLDRNRNNLLFNETDDKPNDKLERRISLDRERILNKRLEDEKKDKDKRSVKKETDKLATPKRQKESTSSSKTKQSTDRDVSIKNSSDLKKRSSSASPKKPPSAKRAKADRQTVYKPFNKLLEGVIFTISGIQNPERADMRAKALALGAKYRTDWDNNCTHLICAFKNTPKYNQVKQANGKIVKRTWIEKCHSQKKRVPWRRYALSSSENDKPESEDEILEISMKPAASPTPIETDTEPPTPKPIETDTEPPTNSLVKDTVALYYLEDDKKDCDVISSGSDTEDEIEKVRQQHREKVAAAVLTTDVVPVEPKDIYDVSTEEEEFTTKQKLKKKFFLLKNFFVNPKLSAVDHTKLTGIIKQFNGNLIDSIKSAHFLISNEPIAGDFTGELVSPLWVYECNDMELLLPTTRYLIS